MIRIVVLLLLLSFPVRISVASSRVKKWLQQPILASGTSREEMNRLIRSRIPPLPAPKTKREWERESQEFRRVFLDTVIFRGVPETWKAWKARTEWVGTFETGKGYLIRKLRYEALPGLWIPALLYEPVPCRGKIPAVLNVNGHVGPPGKGIEYEQIRCINQAKKGILALHPEWFAFGELQGAGYEHNRSAYLDLVGVSGVSVFYLAMRGGLDVLLSHPHTDPDRVGMTGLSGGGWQTILLSALDTRIRLSVPNAGYIGMEYRTENRGDIGDLEQNPTDLLTTGDYPLLTALLAPRPSLLIYNEKDDCCFEAARARPSVYDPIVPFYELFESLENFEFYGNKDPGTHNYEKDNRQQFYRFLFTHFLPDQVPDVEENETTDEIRKPEELHVGLPEENADFRTLAEEIYQSLPERRTNVGLANRRRSLRRTLGVANWLVESSLLRVEQTKQEGAAFYKLEIGGQWSVPLVSFTKGESGKAAVVLTDGGRPESFEKVRVFLDGGYRVLAVDLLLTGECRPEGVPSWKYSQMISAAGERPLGIQVSQLLAVVRWACREYDLSNVVLSASGPVSQVVSLCTAALDPSRIGRVETSGGLESLYDLIHDEVRFGDCPSLFCFGLLRTTDIRDLEELARSGETNTFSVSTFSAGPASPGCDLSGLLKRLFPGCFRPVRK